MKNIFLSIFSVIIFLHIASFFLKPVFFVNADLGRHLKNGEIFSKQGIIPSTNFYSYTEKEYPVVNHHWGSGVVFYWVHKFFGFEGLTILNTLLCVGAMLFFFMLAKKHVGFEYSIITLVLCIPLLTYRTEIRPEAFSYFLVGLYSYIFYKYQKGEIHIKNLLLILLPIQIVWVNLHIFYIFSFPIAFAFLFNRFNISIKSVAIILSLMIVSLINPYHIYGLIEPFFIFKEYGYMVIENQTLFFMHQRFPDKIIYYQFDLIALIFIVLWIVKIVKSKWNLSTELGFSLLTFLYIILSYKIIRSIPLAALFSLFSIPYLLKQIIGKVQNSFLFKTAIFSVLLWVVCVNYLTIYQSNFSLKNGIGLLKNIDASAKFILRNNISGPIFNNYDIGGYYIYYLFPKHPVFVDNRPEAYSSSFFKNTYYPMMEKEKTWQRMDSIYQFNAIYFYRHDATEFAQPFLIKRIEDSLWEPVFVDATTIILLKNNEINKSNILQHKLPKSMFSSVPNKE